MKDYGAKIEETFLETASEKKNVYCHIMYKDIFDLSNIWKRTGILGKVQYSLYEKFSLTLEPHSFFSRLQQYVLAYISLKDVISMDSSLRISTIQSLGK